MMWVVSQEPEILVGQFTDSFRKMAAAIQKSELAKWLTAACSGLLQNRRRLFGPLSLNARSSYPIRFGAPNSQPCITRTSARRSRAPPAADELWPILILGRSRAAPNPPARLARL